MVNKPAIFEIKFEHISWLGSGLLMLFNVYYSLLRISDWGSSKPMGQTCRGNTHNLGNNFRLEVNGRHRILEAKRWNVLLHPVAIPTWKVASATWFNWNLGETLEHLRTINNIGPFICRWLTHDWQYLAMTIISFNWAFQRVFSLTKRYHQRSAYCQEGKPRSERKSCRTWSQGAHHRCPAHQATGLAMLERRLAELGGSTLGFPHIVTIPHLTSWTTNLGNCHDMPWSSMVYDRTIPNLRIPRTNANELTNIDRNHLYAAPPLHQLWPAAAMSNPSFERTMATMAACVARVRESTIHLELCDGLVGYQRIKVGVATSGYSYIYRMTCIGES